MGADDLGCKEQERLKDLVKPPSEFSRQLRLVQWPLPSGRLDDFTRTAP